MHEEDDAHELRRVAATGEVSDEGTTGGGFPAWAVVIGHGRGGCGMWRLRSGLVRKREKERLGLGFVLVRR